MYFSFYSMRRSQRVWLVCLALSLALFASSALTLWPTARPDANVGRPTSVLRRAAEPNPRVRLPQFDPVILINSINRSSRATGVTVGTIDLTLERSADAAYTRYRSRFQVSGTYAAVKEFVFSEDTAQPVRWLDHIHCLRDAANAKAVRCDLALSAFYDRLPHDGQ